MKKVTINDFSGGIQESTIPDDFSARQWAQLKGIIPTSELNFESQWPMQTVGSSFTGVRAVYPLVATTGTYLIAIKTNGTIWWAKSPAVTSAYTVANAISWTQLTTAENKDASGSTINIQSNTDYKFICTIPLQTYKYATTPDPADADNPSKDSTPAFALTSTSAVVLNSTTLNGAADGAGQQVVIVFVDTTNDSCKAITFPNARRIPLHDKEEGDFIKAFVGDDTYVSVPNWFTDTSPYRAMHPYLYLDADAALLPGTGIVPRSNTGVYHQGMLMLGDIEWRSDLAIDVPTKTEVFLSSVSGVNEFANDEYQINWPAEIPSFSRVIYIHDGNVAYFKNDSNMVGTIVNYNITSGVATFTTIEEHGFLEGETVEISRLGAQYNGTFEVNASPTTYTFSVNTTKPDTSPAPVNVSNKEANGTKAIITTSTNHNFVQGDTVYLDSVDAALNGLHVINNIVSGTVFEFASAATIASAAATGTAVSPYGRPVVNVTNKEANGTKAIITTQGNHHFLEGDTVYIAGVDAALNGLHVINKIVSATVFEYASGATVASAAASGTAVSPVGRAVCYDYLNYVGEYQTIPNSWTDIWVTSDVAGMQLKAVTNLNTATHLLNDSNTGPHRSAVYFSTGADLDMYDPRGVLNVGKTDVQVVGLHTLDDTLIAITTAGSQNDGVYRIRGKIERLIQYGEASDPNAVRIELVRGGLGAPKRTANTYKAYSTTWSDAGVVVFIDRLGGIWYTNGKECDRLDRYGPLQPKGATDDDHAAELGKNLFIWRDGRLLCLTMMESSPDGRSGTACWTEVNVPTSISSMIGAGQELFFVMGGKVCRMCAYAPDTERATYDNSPLTITVSTLTAGDAASHLRTNWHKFGMTFSTPTSCTVGTVKVQSTGALNVPGAVSLPDVQYTTTLNRAFSNKGIIGEFMVNAGIGPQAMCSATVTFTGYVQLQSASFWITGNTPRIGDQ